ncbi:PAS domain-containing protein [Cyanobacteria bacterium FACHB-DQ100]|nr:PAS domain-containing protein [Cyanobacteria bacterium FACHB-DQ100]
MKRDKTGKFIQAWDGEQKHAVKLSLTRTAWQRLQQQAGELGISRSELVEHYARHSHYCFAGSNTVDDCNTEASRLPTVAMQSVDPGSDQLLIGRIFALQERNIRLQEQIVKLQQTVEKLRSQQQQADAQINERKWLEAALNLLPTPLMMVDPQQMRVTFSNQAANAIAGVNIAEEVGAVYNADYHCTDELGRFLPPEQIPAIRAARGEKIAGTEINWHTPVGVFPLLVYADTLPAMYDRPPTSVVVFQDIRERKQIEAQLKESQRFIQQVADAIPGVLYIYDLIEQRNVYANRQVGEILGYTIEQVQAMGNQLFPLLMHPDDLATLPAHLERFNQAQDGDVIEREYRMRHADGEWRWLWSRDQVFSRTQAGAPHQVLGISHDITDSKQAELKLKQAEESLQLALTSAGMVAWDMDLQTHQVVCSPNALEVWGVQAGTAEDFFRNVHPDDQDSLIQALAQAIAGKEDYFHEYRVLSPDQTVRWLSSQGRVYFNHAGQAIRMVGVTTDISDAKHREAERICGENERKQAEIAAARSAERTVRLQSVTAALSEALTPCDVATVIVKQALAALGACRGLVMLLSTDQKELELIRSIGYSPDALSEWRRFPVTAAVPLAHVIHTRTPVFLQSIAEATTTYPQVAALQNKISSGAIAAIPLIAEDQVLGVLGIGFTEAHPICEEDRAFMLALARQCAQAIRRSQLYQAEQEARASAEASESRLRFMAEAIPQMVWVAQANGFTEYYNQRWFEYTGLTLEESQNANGSFRHPDDHDRFIQAWIKAVTNKEIFQAEQRIKRADGIYRWHLSRAYPMLDETGEIVKWFGSCTDIDNWKRIEQTQRFLAQASQTFAEANLDLQAVLDTVTRLASEFTQDVCVLNLLADDGQFLEHASFYHPDLEVRSFVGELLEQYPRRITEGIGGRVARTGEPLLMAVTSQEELSAAIQPEYRLYLERFQVCSVLLVPLKVQGGTIGVLSLTRHSPADPHTQDDLSLFQDLADRAAMAIANARLYQQAEQARQRAERNADRTARLQSVTAALSESLTPVQVAEVIAQQTVGVVNAASVLVALITPQGNELEIIHSLGEKAEIPSEWRRFSLALRTPLTDAVRTGQPMWEEPLEERIARYPHLAEQYAQASYPVWISLPLIVEGRSIGGIAITFTHQPQLRLEDRAFMLSLVQQCAQAIARAQLYEAEQRARSQAEAANRTKDEFLAVLSHELRTPMNPILGWARILRQGKLDPQRAATALATIERNAKLQVQLIEDLLDISRILQGKLRVNPCPVNLAATIDAALQTVRLAAEAKDIQIQTNIGTEVANVLGDAGRLQQVLWNLLSNAVKFTPEQGQIEVRLTIVHAQAQIQVQDTGKGIQPDFLPYVFEYFRQADSSSTRTFGGLGLGLAIARQIVELHGGTIQAESSGEGQGSTFTVRLPLLSIPALPEQEKTLANNELALQEIQVLVVDDEIDNLELATFILEEAGASVVAVSSAQAALECFRQTKPDVLLADIGMPEMDGYLLLRYIRALEAEQGDRPTSAIALTAYASEADQQQARAAGFQCHLPKPVEPEALLQAILGLVRT